MKNFKYILFTLLISTICVSCDWLEPETNETNTIYYSAATLINDSISGKNIFLTDDNLQLHPTELITIPDAKKDSLLNKRYYISFQVKEQIENRYSINLLSSQMMREIEIIEIESNEQIAKYKNEILTINRLWTSGTYLNIVSEIKGSGNKLHNYHLLYNPNITTDTLNLTLRYDHNNDTEDYNLQEATTYNLKNYINTQQDSIIIRLDYNSYFPEYSTIYIKTATR